MQIGWHGSSDQVLDMKKNLRLQESQGATRLWQDLTSLLVKGKRDKGLARKNGVEGFDD